MENASHAIPILFMYKSVPMDDKKLADKYIFH